ncbi:MAG: flagellar hook-basal body complex protein FliE [Lachnospiraceae bacterium]|jgi:flagellar hook-basal body complex protein FliE|nr:flagellar hook-basal body complex protein FliE [Lachnospiraceae bacterium]
MDITAIKNLYQSTPVTDSNNTVEIPTNQSEDFGAIFDSVMNMVNETNTLANKASAEEIKFAMGESDNTHDLMIAEKKAEIALQYTVAVRDRFIQSYQTIMNMQI